MFNIIIYSVLGLLSILLLILIVQICIGVFAKPKKGVGIGKKYTEEVIRQGNRSVQAVKSGDLKKQLLVNDSQPYDSNEALEQYETFVDESPVYKKLLSLEEKRYHG